MVDMQVCAPCAVEPHLEHLWVRPCLQGEVHLPSLNMRQTSGDEEVARFPLPGSPDADGVTASGKRHI